MSFRRRASIGPSRGFLPEHCFFLAKEDVLGLERSLLFGYGLMDDAVLFGAAGLRAYHVAGFRGFPKEGRFSGVFLERDDAITIRADRTGQDLIYLYRNGDDWA